MWSQKFVSLLFEKENLLSKYLLFWNVCFLKRLLCWKVAFFEKFALWNICFLKYFAVEIYLLVEIFAAICLDKYLFSLTWTLLFLVEWYDLWYSIRSEGKSMRSETRQRLTDKYKYRHRKLTRFFCSFSCKRKKGWASLFKWNTFKVFSFVFLKKAKLKQIST